MPKVCLQKFITYLNNKLFGAVGGDGGGPPSFLLLPSYTTINYLNSWSPSTCLPKMLNK